MKKWLGSLGSVAVLGLIVGACTTKPVFNEHTHDGSASHTHDASTDRGVAQLTEGEEPFHNHAELGVKLEPDSPFCDENENGKIDEAELAAGANCRESSEGQGVFALKPIASFGLKKGQLILTTDDGPNSVVSPKIYDLLKSYGIHGTFFLTGNLIPKNASLVQRLVREGHTVGNHTYSHDVPNITATTIKDEIHKAHAAVMTALSQASDGKQLQQQFSNRLLFRAPGLGWNAAKGTNLNSDKNDITYQYIGPFHANLGTDAPRADWSCWSKGVSSETCAQWYFEDIVNTGRGVILSHDVFYKSAFPTRNTYEMLRILLQKLDTQAGGICNKPGAKPNCVWTFKTFRDPDVEQSYANLIADSGYLANKGHVVQPDAQPAVPGGAITTFSNTAVVRNESLRNYTVMNDATKAATTTGLSTVDLASVVDLHQDLTIDGTTFKLVRITGLKSGNSQFLNKNVYIWNKAF